MKLHTLVSTTLFCLLLVSGGALADQAWQLPDINAELQQRIDRELEHTVERADARQQAEQLARDRAREQRVMALGSGAAQAPKLLAKLTTKN